MGIRSADKSGERIGMSDSKKTFQLASAGLTFERMRCTAEQTAGALGKQVNWKSTGENVLLDSEVLRHIDELLIQLIRNAIDHGIESAESRRAAGKDVIGTVRLSLHERDGNAEIVLADDGRGIDSHYLIQTAILAGIAEPEQKFSRAEALELIFVPGLSTRAAPNEISGRGIGMEIVRAQIEALGASLEIETAIGVGTTFRIRIPAASAASRPSRQSA